MARVALEGIGKSFGAAAVLRDVSLGMAEGELVSLLGPSGCGKTTLLRILAGFERPDAGRVVVDGEDLGDLAPNRRAMGMVFQAYSLFPNMTARQNVAFGLRVRGTARAEQTRRAAALLDLVGLSAHAEKYPRQLSGGQQQRVALARALAIEPRVLLLDEPLSALDAQVRVQLREEIRRVQLRTGVTTVFVTHDQEEALSISDRVAVMHEGRIRQLDTPSRIYREPADGFVAGFVGAASVFAGTAAGRAVRCDGIALPAAAAGAQAEGAAVALFVRPEHVRVAEAAAPGALAGEVAELTFLGSLTRLRITLDAPAGAALRADLPSEAAERLRPGARVWASWDDAAPRVLGRG